VRNPVPDPIATDMTRTTSLLLVMVLLLASCDTFSTSDSEQLTGSYDLVLAGVKPVPVEVWREQGVSGVLASERLEFLVDGSVIRSHRFVETELATGTEEVFEYTEEMEYRRSGRSIEIGRFTPCPPNALCAPNDIGTLRSGGLDLASFRWTSGDPIELTYGRR